MITPTLIAYVALLAWVPLSFFLFAATRPDRATVLVILGGVLLLPAHVSFDFPLFPPMGRENISLFCAFIGCLIFARRRLTSVWPGSGLESFLVIILLSAWVTVLTNRDPLAYGPVALPPLSLHTGVSHSVELILTLWVPFHLGRCLFRRPSDLGALFVLLVAAAIIYSLPILYEIRMSPRLHREIYGFNQHAFGQTMRWGGYRPMVFMSHGLALALFVFSASAAAVGLWRSRIKVFGISALPAGLYLSVILVGVKSMAAICYGAVVLPLIGFAKARTMIRLAFVLAIIVFLYPLSRGFELFPTDEVVSAIGSLSEDRAESIRQRFYYDEFLLEHARERPWFGWGTWGRHRVYDPLTGEDLAITDGFWIIVLSMQGIVGLAATFALLLGPVFVAVRHWNRIGSARDQLLVATATWIVTISALDLMPNAMLTPFLVLLTGALTGAVEGAVEGARVTRASGARRSRTPPSDDEPAVAASRPASLAQILREP